MPSFGVGTYAEAILSDQSGMEHSANQGSRVYRWNSDKKDIRILEIGVHVVAGTPDRLFDMISRNYLNLSSLRMFITDEADKLLYRGLKRQIQDMLNTYQGTPSAVCSLQQCLMS